MGCINRKCDTCAETTKHVVGFWDGKNDTHGCIYDCENQLCEVKIIIDATKSEDIQNRIQVQQINGKNAVFMGDLRHKRNDRGILVFDMANHLGISSSLYSRYENEKETMPKELYDRAIQFVMN